MKNKQSPFRAALRKFEADYWLQLLEECKGCVAEAARRSGCRRTFVHERLTELGVRNPYRGPLQTPRRGNWGSLTH